MARAKYNPGDWPDYINALVAKFHLLDEGSSG